MDDPHADEKSGMSLQAKLDALRERQTAAKSKDFQTPEEVAASDDLSQPAQLVATGAANDPTEPTQILKKGGWRDKLKLSWPPRKKEWIVIAVAVLLCSSGTAFALLHNNKPPVAAVKHIVKVKVPPKPKTVASTLSGLQVDQTLNAKPVTAVMIENSPEARPQAGLGQASVVFEAIAEGGITRFLSLFQDTSPENVGPIRSARPYYLQWELGFDAGYAHVGGSPEALQDIIDWGVHDLDQFAYGGSYHRIIEKAAPHNVYTSISLLNQLEASNGLTSSKFAGFVRKPTEQPAKVPTAKTIDLSISGPIYNPHYDYLPATNNYNRSEGGEPHIDANSNAPISPKVVIGLVMSYGIQADGKHSEYNTIGSGVAYIFQDGGVTIGQWNKPSANAQFTFTDSTGKTIGLNAGQTWLTAVSDTSNITSAP